MNGNGEEIACANRTAAADTRLQALGRFQDADGDDSTVLGTSLHGPASKMM